MNSLTPRDTGREFYIYVMISETPTKFGGVIRRVGRIRYNHASIAFDDEFRQLYSFGRRQSGNPLSAGLVREHLDRFTLRKKLCVNVRIYRLRVSREQYLTGKKRIRQIMLDTDGYLYNLFSVLSYPVLHGFRTYKAYSCAEFVANVLYNMGIGITDEVECCACTPEQIGDVLGCSPYFEGNLLDYCTYRPKDADRFFDRPKYSQIARTSCSVAARLIYRKIRYGSCAAGY